MDMASGDDDDISLIAHSMLHLLGYDHMTGGGG